MPVASSTCTGVALLTAVICLQVGWTPSQQLMQKSMYVSITVISCVPVTAGSRLIAASELHAAICVLQCVQVCSVWTLREMCMGRKDIALHVAGANGRPSDCC